MSTTAHPAPLLVSRGLYGAVAGVGGGIVFGMLMAMVGMLTSVAMLVGSNNAVVGAVVHLVISAVLGVGFALVAPFARIWSLLGAGVVYGAFWWVLGGLVLMPAGLGMPVLQMNTTAMQSLMGHLVYGIVTALVLFGFRHRASRQ